MSYHNNINIPSIQTDLSNNDINNPFITVGCHGTHYNKPIGSLSIGKNQNNERSVRVNFVVDNNNNDPVDSIILKINDANVIENVSQIYGNINNGSRILNVEYKLQNDQYHEINVEGDVTERVKKASKSVLDNLSQNDEPSEVIDLFLAKLGEPVEVVGVAKQNTIPSAKINYTDTEIQFEDFKTIMTLMYLAPMLIKKDDSTLEKFVLPLVGKYFGISEGEAKKLVDFWTPRVAMDPRPNGDEKKYRTLVTNLINAMCDPSKAKDGYQDGWINPFDFANPLDFVRSLFSDPDINETSPAYKLAKFVQKNPYLSLVFTEFINKSEDAVSNSPHLMDNFEELFQDIKDEWKHTEGVFALMKGELDQYGQDALRDILQRLNDNGELEGFVQKFLEKYPDLKKTYANQKGDLIKVVTGMVDDLQNRHPFHFHSLLQSIANIDIDLISLSDNLLDYSIDNPDIMKKLIGTVKHIESEHLVNFTILLTDLVDTHPKEVLNILNSALSDDMVDALEPLVDKIKNCTSKKSQEINEFVKDTTNYLLGYNFRGALCDDLISICDSFANHPNEFKNLLGEVDKSWLTFNDVNEIKKYIEKDYLKLISLHATVRKLLLQDKDIFTKTLPQFAKFGNNHENLARIGAKIAANAFRYDAFRDMIFNNIEPKHLENAAVLCEAIDQVHDSFNEMSQEDVMNYFGNDDWCDTRSLPKKAPKNNKKANTIKPKNIRRRTPVTPNIFKFNSNNIYNRRLYAQFLPNSNDKISNLLNVQNEKHQHLGYVPGTNQSYENEMRKIQRLETLFDCSNQLFSMMINSEGIDQKLVDVRSKQDTLTNRLNAAKANLTKRQNSLANVGNNNDDDEVTREARLDWLNAEIQMYESVVNQINIAIEANNALIESLEIINNFDVKNPADSLPSGNLGSHLKGDHADAYYEHSENVTDVQKVALLYDYKRSVYEELFTKAKNAYSSKKFEADRALCNLKKKHFIYTQRGSFDKAIEIEKDIYAKEHPYLSTTYNFVQNIIGSLYHAG